MPSASSPVEDKKSECKTVSNNNNNWWGSWISSAKTKVEFCRKLKEKRNCNLKN